ncbi:uncharacterized protein EI90DRAFT_3098327 [Cantharellus anzutake]|uniref:uncharacterized protein n=1 Tax=Cantharellus anzutake TaxID=1750568 RepID=UPI0019057941|nr:uncharacterized protein EI90DRAFT_3098327 [Cantharellus anzutake]KAF8311039.1 hypothetical protein EI90DRAFT_3098327 [Cantharellus anzutake]
MKKKSNRQCEKVRKEETAKEDKRQIGSHSPGEREIPGDREREKGIHQGPFIGMTR